MTQPSSTFSDSKKHYPILDGLRGVAAITVVAFHLFETFSEGDHKKQIINHGYLAVDFFFLLSGFVIGYAYDDRWKRMTLADFFKRRLIRLHPMIVAGMFIGAIAFYFQACSYWPQIGAVPWSKLLVVTLVGCTLLPLPLSLDVRGWQEMHPLDGPAWSLFFEYVANLLYALVVSKFSNRLLFAFVVVAGAALVHLAVTSNNGDIIGGWSLDPPQLRIGLTRLLYPFFAGLLLKRVVRLITVRRAFLWSSLLLLAVLAMPRVGANSGLWMNGLYDSFAVILLFPFIVFLGASGETKEPTSAKLCKFLGDISYPLYIIHYPFVYLFMAWTANNKIESAEAGNANVITVAVGVWVTSIALAYACLKWYDEQVRKWLTKRFASTVLKEEQSLKR